jgi:hypothetical protein
MSSIPLICFGKRREIAARMSEGLAPEFTYIAILNEWTTDSDDSKAALKILIQHLHPAPAGIIVGSAFDESQQQAIKSFAEENQLGFVAVPIGYLRDHGAEETLKWCKNALLKEFGNE